MMSYSTKMKIANIILCIICITSVWFTSAELIIKAFISVFFTLIIGFWLVLKTYEKGHFKNY